MYWPCASTAAMRSSSDSRMRICWVFRSMKSIMASILSRQGCVIEEIDRAGMGAGCAGLTGHGELKPLAVFAHPSDLPGGHAHHEGVGRHVGRHDGPGADEGVFPDGYAAHDRAVGAQRGPPFHQCRAVLGLAFDARPRVVAVGEDHARPAKDVVVERASVIQRHVVLNLAVIADRGPSRDEDVLTYGDVGADACPGADMAEVPYPSPWPDSGTGIKH